MAPILKTRGIDTLSLDERIELADALWESIEQERAGFDLTTEQRAELDRRWADHQASPDDVVPWSQIKREAEERLGA